MTPSFSIKEFLYWFGVLGIVFLPSPVHLSGGQPLFPFFIWERPLEMFSLLLTGHESAPGVPGSDSKALYLLTLILFMTALFVSLMLIMIRSWDRRRFFMLAELLFSLYLGLIMMGYGCDKLFKVQFYMPETNILYTPVGQLDKDILYWSTIGSSYGYNIFLGSMEVICSFLLLWRRTRMAGVIAGILILMNVVAVNIFFDISVKLYSVFLFSLCVLLLLPHMKRLADFLSGKAVAAIQSGSVFFTGLPYLRIALKTFCVLLLMFEGMYAAIRTGNFNDDKFPRPYLHGVYENMDDSVGNVKRVFIHRDGWIIFQDAKDNMEDHRLRIDSSVNLLLIQIENARWKSLPYNYHVKDSILELVTGKDPAVARFKAADWKQLPLLRNQFHWTVDYSE